MKRFILLLMTLLSVNAVTAQNTLNDKADNIVGTYSGKQGDDKFKVKIVKLTDGTYRGQVIWLEIKDDTINDISVFNSSGKRVYIDANIERSDYSLNLTSFAKGVYYVAIQGAYKQYKK